MSSAEVSSPSEVPADDLAKFPYIGWIPTANGRLSFRHIGDSRHPTESIFANLALDQSRIVLAYQRRPLSDILFPDIIHYVASISGDFWFVLCAETVSSPLQSDEISGSILIYKSKEDWRGKADDLVREKIRTINGLRFSFASDRDDIARQAFSKASEVVRGNDDIRIDFSLARDGEVRFATPIFRDPELEFASTSFAEQGGHDFKKWVADQAYFFLRDICHAHQHHDSYSDTILILQERDAGDIQWRRNIVFSLYYAIIRAKRDGQAASMFQSIGILAYCRSFKAVCEQRLGADFVKVPVFHDDPLLQSLNAKASEVLATTDFTTGAASIAFAKASNLRTFALAAVAIIIAALAILIQPRISDGEKEKFPLLNDASTFAAENFFSLIGLCSVILVVTWVITHSGWTVSTKTGRAILEASNVRRVPAVLIYLGLAIGGAAASAYAFKPAVQDILSTLADLWRLVF